MNDDNGKVVGFTVADISEDIDNLKTTEDAALQDESGNTDLVLPSDYSPDQQLVKNIAGAMKAGKTTLAQKFSRNILEINDDWVLKIEATLRHIDNIIRNPKSFILEQREVVAVEKARKVDGESVRHLASHTENIRKLNKDGSVEPSRISTKFLDINVAIYENRFIYTLVLALQSFVERKLSAIKSSNGNRDVALVDIGSDFLVGKTKCDYKLSLSIDMTSKNKTVSDKNDDLCSRLEFVAKRLKSYSATDFWEILKKTKPLNPPIMRTNLLVKHTDYRACYDLWVFISGFSEIGFTTSKSEKNLPFDKPYFEIIADSAAQTFVSILENNKFRQAIYDSLHYRMTKKSKFKQVRDIRITDKNKGVDGVLDENNPINEYYFNSIRRLAKGIEDISRAYEISDVETVNARFRKFFKGIEIINNKMYAQLLNLDKLDSTTEKVTIANKKKRIKDQQLRIKKYHLLTKLKQDEVALAKKREEVQEARLAKLEKELEALEKREALKKAKEAEKMANALKKAKDAAALKKEKEEKAAALKKEKEAAKLKKAKEAAALKKKKEKAAENKKIKQKQTKAKKELPIKQAAIIEDKVNREAMQSDISERVRVKTARAMLDEVHDKALSREETRAKARMRAEKKRLAEQKKAEEAAQMKREKEERERKEQERIRKTRELFDKQMQDVIDRENERKDRDNSEKDVIKINIKKPDINEKSDSDFKNKKNK